MIHQLVKTLDVDSLEIKVDECQSEHSFAVSYQKIDLSSWLDSKSFNYQNKEIADFSGISEWFLHEKEIKNEIGALVDEFEWYIGFQNEYDSISCLEQVIDDLDEECDGLIVLASAAIQHFATQICLETMDGNLIEFDFICSSWVQRENNEKIVLKMKRMHQHADGNMRMYEDLGYIYEYQFKLPVRSNVRCIHLPLCPNIHIFSMSLVKYESWEDR